MAEHTPVTIPIELLEQVDPDNVLLYVGDHLSRDRHGEAVSDRLTVELAERARIANPQPLTSPEVAQAYEDQHGHQLIAGLTQCGILATTALSGWLEPVLDLIGGHTLAAVSAS